MVEAGGRALVLVGVCGLVLILAALHFLGGGAVKTYTVRVVVDGRPAPDVSVTVQFPDGSTRTLTTDEDGYITFEGPPGAKIVDIGGGFEASLPVDAEVGIINLKAPKRKVVVIVKDEEGNPLTADVKILVNGEVVHEESGDTVACEVAGLESDTILIKASAEGFRVAQKAYTFRSLPGKVVLTLKRQETHRKKYGTVVVLVKDERGRGVDGRLRVYVKGSAIAVAETEIAGGYAAVEGLQYGTYTLKVFRGGALLAEKDVVVSREITEVEITVVGEPVQRAVLRVLDKTNRRPVPGATVEVTTEGKTWAEKTDSAGVLELGLRENTCADLYITAHGYKAAATTVCAGDEANVLLDRLPASGAILVRVYNQLGQPVPNARVYLISGDHVVGDVHATDEEGRVRIEDVEPGTYIVKAEVGAYTGTSDPVEVRVGRTSSADVYVFPKEANVVVRVRVDGAPASAAVEAYAAGRKIREGVTDIDGTASFTVPADVDVRFHVYGPVTFVSRPYRFVPGEIREITVDVPAEFSGVKILGVYREGVQVEGIAPGTTYALRFMYRTESGEKVVVAVTDGYWGVSLLGAGWTFRGWNSPPGSDPIGQALQSTAEGRQIAIKDAVGGAVVEEEILLQASSTLVGDYVTVHVGAGEHRDSITLIIGDSMLCGNTVCYSAGIVQGGDPVEELKAEYPAEIRVTVIPKAEIPGLRADVVYTDAEGTGNVICTLSIAGIAEKVCPFVPKEGAVEMTLRVKRCGGTCEDIEELTLAVTNAVAEHRQMGMIVRPTALVAVRKEQEIEVMTYDAESTAERGLTPVDARVSVYAYVSTGYAAYKMLVLTANTVNGRVRLRITPAENWDHVELVARARDYEDATFALSLQDRAVDVSPMHVQIDLTVERSAQLTVANLMDAEVAVDIVPRNPSRCISVEVEPGALILEGGAEKRVEIRVSGGETCLGQVDVPISVIASIGPARIEYAEPVLSVYPKGNCLRVEAPGSFSFAPDRGGEVRIKNVCEVPLDVLVESDDPAIVLTPAEVRIPARGEQRIHVSYQPAGGEVRAEGEVTITASYQHEDRYQSVYASVPYTYFDESACVTLEETVQGHYEDGMLVANVVPEISGECGVLRSVSGGGGCSVGVGDGVLRIECKPDLSRIESGYAVPLELRFVFDRAVDVERLEIEAPPVSGDPVTIQAHPYKESVAEVSVLNNFPVDLDVSVSFRAPSTIYYADSLEPGSAFERVTRRKIRVKANEARTFYISVERPCTVWIRAKVLGRTYTASVELTAGIPSRKVVPPLIGKDAYTADVPAAVSVEEYAKMCKTSWCTEDAYEQIRGALRGNLDALDPLTRHLAGWYFVVLTDEFEGRSPGYYLVSWEDGREKWSDFCWRYNEEACRILASSAATLARSEAMRAEDCSMLAGQLEALVEDSEDLAKEARPVVFAVKRGTYPGCTGEVYVFHVVDDAYIAVREGTTVFGGEGAVRGPAYITTGTYWAVRNPDITCPKNSVEIAGRDVPFSELKRTVTFDRLREEDGVAYVVLEDVTPTTVRCRCGEGDSFRYTRTLLCYRGAVLECNGSTLGTARGEWLCVREEGAYGWLRCSDELENEEKNVAVADRVRVFVCRYDRESGHYWAEKRESPQQAVPALGECAESADPEYSWVCQKTLPGAQPESNGCALYVDGEMLVVDERTRAYAHGMYECLPRDGRYYWVAVAHG